MKNFNGGETWLGVLRLGAWEGECGGRTVLRGQQDGTLAPFIESCSEEMAGLEGGGRRGGVLSDRFRND
jgi:hypothetical protein